MEKNELSDRLNEMYISNLKIPKCTLEEKRAQVAENQTQILILKLSEMQWKYKSLPQNVLALEVRAPTGKEWDSVPWDGEVWEDPYEAKDFEL